MNVKKTDDTQGIVLLNDDNELSTCETSDRYYSFCIVTYAYDCNINAFLECGEVTNYAYILHDKDDTDKHIHLLFTTKQAHTCKNISNFFNDITDATQNTFCRPIRKSTIQAYKYLTHSTDRAIAQGKKPYDESLIVTNNAARWVFTHKDSVISADDLTDDLLSDDFSVAYMCRKYGRDFMRNIRAYMQTRELLLDERRKNK